MRYLVTTRELKWFTCTYVVEADSEDDVYKISRDELLSGFEDEDFDCDDEYTIIGIDKYES